jgi:hypothetical protein
MIYQINLTFVYVFIGVYFVFDKECQWIATGLWFSRVHQFLPPIKLSHNITEMVGNPASWAFSITGWHCFNWTLCMSSGTPQTRCLLWFTICFPHYNAITTIERTPLLRHQERAEELWGLEPPSRVPNNGLLRAIQENYSCLTINIEMILLLAMLWMLFII